MSHATRLVRPSKLRVRAPRVPIDLEVESRTIGTSAAYRFQTEDISRSGLLLVWDREVRMPFIVNTLLEMTIDPTGTCLQKPVTCLGKVVRRDGTDESNSHSARLGIQIVQIDNTDLTTWEGCLSELEKRFGIELSNRVAPAAGAA
jgi:hypothetical protein